MHDLPAKLNALFKGRDSYPFARPPGIPGNQTDTVGTDVLGIGQLNGTRRAILCAGAELHDDGNRETFFDSSVESMDDGHIASWSLPKFLRLEAQAPSPTAVQLGLIVLRHT